MKKHLQKKKKKLRKKMKKWQIENLETSENIGNLEKVIASFLISEFSIFSYSQSRKLGFKNLGKKFPRFPSFRPGQKRPMKKHRKIAHKRSNLNNCEEFVVMAGGLRDHFTTFMKRCKSKTGREVKGSNFLKT